MATFLMFGKYSQRGLRGISASRTRKAATLIKKGGGRLLAAYAVLGAHDLVLIVELAGTKEAMKTSIALAKFTGIGFTTSPALSVAEFDRLK